ncbi:uncharacterized protein LOC108138362 [Drosophila elegans]|uniref:uncharacterized protein LOC108138362 n=1 Tax=Drosophila elegans TaxID=30023 RepID=UPI0007E69E43|nr:uncharacterized protein LOC108138362 [Drosophila elegans]
MTLSSTVVFLLAGLFLIGLVQRGAGARLQQQQSAASYPAAGFKPGRQFDLPAGNSKPARLVANSEAQEDLDDAVEEVEMTQPRAPPVPRPVLDPVPKIPVIPTIAYYPAGAVGFVRPAEFAKIISGPQQSAGFAATNQYYAAYFG